MRGEALGKRGEIDIDNQKIVSMTDYKINGEIRRIWHCRMSKGQLAEVGRSQSIVIGVTHTRQVVVDWHTTNKETTIKLTHAQKLQCILQRIWGPMKAMRKIALEMRMCC